MIVVSDATPITTLLKAGEVELLRKLFGSVIIPRAVADELLAYHEQLPAFVAIRTVLKPGQFLPRSERLGIGITWPLLDEDLGIDGMLYGVPSIEYRRQAAPTHATA